MIEFGTKIKKLRKQKNMTLKDLATKSNLSIGFLSQLERNLTTVAVDSLQNIAQALDVDFNYFFTPTDSDENYTQIVRSYERTVSYSESDRFIHQYLSSDLNKQKIFAEMIMIMPDEQPISTMTTTVFSHAGEEFIYVVEGILTLNLNHKLYKLHQGDTIHLNSKIPHNWYNSTNQIVKILVIRYPNPYADEAEEGEGAEG